MLPGDIHVNAVLVRHGFLGCAPLMPSVAFSLRTLLAYQQLHRATPGLGIQALVKTLCNTNNASVFFSDMGQSIYCVKQVPYRPGLEDQFSIAFDIFLDLLRTIDGRVKIALGRDSPNWRMLNTCPACFYELKGEPELEFAFLCDMDGNSSLKRAHSSYRHTTQRADDRQAQSDYWLHPREVDQFKDEVSSRVVIPLHIDDRCPNLTRCQAQKDPGADITSTDPVAKCIERWRNAGPEEKKRMFEMFDETGIFVTACRHGIVLAVCDMIRSGELWVSALSLSSTVSIYVFYQCKISACYGCTTLVCLRP